MHPGSVWAVCGLPNGDVLTGCSDGVARVWTRSPERTANMQALQTYEASVSAQSIPTGTLGDIKLDSLKGLEELEIPGTKDGQVKVVKNGNTPEAYQWSSGDDRWIKIGEVVDSKNSSRQTLHGKQYDYVFDIDTGDGQMRKLGYNNTDNPYVVAQDFLWKEELDQEWLDQIAQFIIKNAAPITIGEAPQNIQGDPLTGGSRYIPPGSSSMSGQSSYKELTYQHIPLREPLRFDTANLSTIHSKILEFNGKVTNDLAIDSSQQQELASIVAILSNTALFGTSSFSDSNIELIQKMFRWPEELRFPVLDLIRMMLTHSDGAARLASVSQFLHAVIETNLKPNNSAPNQMLAFRIIANSFYWHLLWSSLVSCRSAIYQAIGHAIKSTNKSIRAAAVTVILNYAVLDLKHSGDDKRPLLSMLNQLLNVEVDDEVSYRGLVAIGTLAWNDLKCIQLAKDLKVPNLFQRFSQGNASQRVKEVAMELQNYVR